MSNVSQVNQYNSVISKTAPKIAIFNTYNTMSPHMATARQPSSHNFPKVNNNPKDLSQAAPAPKPVWELLRNN